MSYTGTDVCVQLEGGGFFFPPFHFRKQWHVEINKIHNKSGRHCNTLFGWSAYRDFTDGLLKFKFSLSYCSLNITLTNPLTPTVTLNMYYFNRFCHIICNFVYSLFIILASVDVYRRLSWTQLLQVVRHNEDLLIDCLS